MLLLMLMLYQIGCHISVTIAFALDLIFSALNFSFQMYCFSIQCDHIPLIAILENKYFEAVVWNMYVGGTKADILARNDHSLAFHDLQMWIDGPAILRGTLISHYPYWSSYLPGIIIHFHSKIYTLLLIRCHIWPIYFCLFSEKTKPMVLGTRRAVW